MEIYFLSSMLLVTTGYVCIDYIEHAEDSIAVHLFRLLRRSDAPKRRI